MMVSGEIRIHKRDSKQLPDQLTKTAFQQLKGDVSTPGKLMI